MTFVNSQSQQDANTDLLLGTKPNFDARVRALKHSNSLLWVCNQGDATASKIELRETDSEILLDVIIPHLRADSLDIRLSLETVHIQGEQDADPFDLDWSDYPTPFQHLIPLPSPIQIHAVIAELNHNKISFVFQKAARVPYQFKIEPILCCEVNY
jgi:HSP20 family molecular chaperone IbpA